MQANNFVAPPVPQGAQQWMQNNWNQFHQHQWQQHHQQPQQAPNINNFLGAGNNVQLAQQFQQALNNYQANLPGQDLLVRRHRTREENQQARDAQRNALMQALNINADEYNRQNDLARRLRAHQRHLERVANGQIHQPDQAQRIRNLANRMYPRIIKTNQFDERLAAENIRGVEYPGEDRTENFGQYLGFTLNTIGEDSRKQLQRLFGEWVGLLGFAPEFHRELLTKASAKAFLRDNEETRYRYELYDMDDDFRTPGTLWIYRREHDILDENGNVARHVPEEIYSVGGYVISVNKSANSKSSINMLRDMDYYNTYPTRDERKLHNKREFSLSQHYLTMKPVPALFKMVSDWIVAKFRDAGRKVPSVGNPSYIVFHDVQNHQPIYNVVCKVSTITWNAILSRLTELFLMYYMYPNLAFNDFAGQRFVQQFNNVRIMNIPSVQSNADNDNMPIKQYLYNKWKTNIIHPLVEKKLLANQPIITQIREFLDVMGGAEDLDENGHFLPGVYMAEDQLRVLDSLTSVVCLYFTNSPLRFINKGQNLLGGVVNMQTDEIDYNSFINSNLIFRLCTENEFNNTIAPQIATGATVEYSLTSRATDKVYRQFHVVARGNQYIENPALRINYGAGAGNNNNGGGGGGGNNDDDDDNDNDNGGGGNNINNINNNNLPPSQILNNFDLNVRTEGRENLLHYSTPRSAARSLNETANSEDENNQRKRRIKKRRLNFQHTPPVQNASSLNTP